MKVWKTAEYWMYFPFFKLHSWGKRSAVRRRRFIQRLLYDGLKRSSAGGEASFLNSPGRVYLIFPKITRHKLEKKPDHLK
jgi:hypothetical protein